MTDVTAPVTAPSGKRSSRLGSRGSAALHCTALSTLRPYRLRSRFVVALGLLVATVAFCASGAILAGAFYTRELSAMHRFEIAARRAASVGILAREQYIHEAHTIIAGDSSHVEHHDEWVARFEREVSRFRADLSPDDAERLDAVLADGRELAHIFADVIVPAVTHGDLSKARAAHDESIVVVDRMISHADALEQHFAERAGASEKAASRGASIATIVLVVSCAASAIFSLLVALRLWRAVEAPLRKLKLVAERVSQGDHAARVAPIQAEELAVVGTAVNAMLDALVAQERKLSASDRLAAIGRVAAGVAHEINNPISIIRGYLKTMRREVGDQQLRRELEILDEEAAACQRIAEDLLAYSRAPALQYEDVDIASVVAGAVERSSSGDGGTRARLDVDVAPAQMRIDRVRIQQVVANLLRNARHVSEDNGIISIRGRRVEGDRYILSVADHGPGLSSESRDRLFEPFFTTRNDGVGLGLAVCYGLVSAHGGVIRAEEPAEGGLRLVVELPISPSNPAQ